MTDKQLELAFRHPKFEWSQTITGQPKYNHAGVYLMKNMFPKKKKTKKKRAMSKISRRSKS